MRYGILACLSILMTEAGGAGAGAGGAAPPVTPPVTPPADGGQGTGNPWFSGFKDADVKAYTEAKGFKDPESLALSYRDLEKTRGVPAERLLSLPADDKPESWAPVYDRLGRPKEAKEYELSAVEGAPETFLPALASKFHELGVNKKQGQALAAWWGELAKGAKAEEATQLQEASQNQIATLKKEWGGAFEKNVNTAEALARKAGIDEATALKIRTAIGVDGFAKLLLGVQTKFGIQLGEADFHSTTGSKQFGEGLTPAAAKAKREQLLADPAFKERWMAGGKTEVEQINRTYEQEYSAA